MTTSTGVFVIALLFVGAAAGAILAIWAYHPAGERWFKMFAVWALGLAAITALVGVAFRIGSQ